jgi:hypothetical protein
MRGIVIGLVLLFAVFTFVGAMSQPPAPAPAKAQMTVPSNQ